MKTGVMIQSVERAILIMNCFTKERPEVRLKDIADELGLNKSTVHGLLNTLKNYGFLDQNEETQRYRLGLTLLDLSSRILNSMDIRVVAGAEIRALCDLTGETVHLVLLDGADVVYIDKKESNQSIRIFTSIGTRYPAYATGVGKAILAYKSRDALVNILPKTLNRLTNKTITDREKMFEHLEEVRQRGYAVDDEENLEGLRCIAAPIFDHNNQVVAAISIAGPSSRMSEDRMPELGQSVSQAAQRISKRLGQHN